MAGVRTVGDWIGDRFEIFDIHEGGMSLVYVVHDHLGPSRRSVVALKTLKDELLGHKIRRSRFATECRLWVQLGEHPNIVQAHSVEIFDGKPYVVLELVQGGDLVRWIGTTPPRPAPGSPVRRPVLSGDGPRPAAGAELPP